MNKNRRYSILDGNPMNRRFSTQDGTSLNPQDAECVPSHRCLILDQSFEALKSARSSTETMKRVQQEMERAVNTEGEKNDKYKQRATEYTSFAEEMDNTAHGLEDTTPITGDETAKCTENETRQTVVRELHHESRNDWWFNVNCRDINQSHLGTWVSRNDRQCKL